MKHLKWLKKGGLPNRISLTQFGKSGKTMQCLCLPTWAAEVIKGLLWIVCAIMLMAVIGIRKGGSHKGKTK